MKQGGVGGWVGMTRDKWFQFAHSPSRLMTTHVSVAGGGVTCAKLGKDHRGRAGVMLLNCSNDLC